MPRIGRGRLNEIWVPALRRETTSTAAGETFLKTSAAGCLFIALQFDGGTLLAGVGDPRCVVVVTLGAFAVSTVDIGVVACRMSFEEISGKTFKLEGVRESHPEGTHGRPKALLHVGHWNGRSCRSVSRQSGYQVPGDIGTVHTYGSGRAG